MIVILLILVCLIGLLLHLDVGQNVSYRSANLADDA